MVPGDTAVSISAYTAHRDPIVFPDPEAFRPERWLAMGDDRLKDKLTRFIPFSAGSRSCIGQNVSSLEQQFFLATLCYRYDFTLPSGEWEMEWEEYFNLWPVRLPLKIWRREVQAYKSGGGAGWGSTHQSSQVSASENFEGTLPTEAFDKTRSFPPPYPV